MAHAAAKLREEQCKETVVKYEGLARYTWQCKRKAVSDGFCTIHSPSYIAKRNAERKAKWDKESEQKQAAYRLQAAAPELLAALRELLAVSWGSNSDKRGAEKRAEAAIHKAECDI